MSRNSLPELELRARTAPWPSDNDNDAYVIKWTDAGWRELELRGLRPELRREMDVATSLLMIDLEDRPRQRAPHEIRKDWSLALPLVKKALSRVNKTAVAHTVIGTHHDQTAALITALRTAERILAAGYQPTTIENRRNRAALFEFAVRINVITDRCGIPLKRSDQSLKLVDYILKAIAPFAGQYLATLADMGEEYAGATASRIRQQRAESLVKHVREQERSRPLP